jgi:hypothetical protein
MRREPVFTVRPSRPPCAPHGAGHEDVRGPTPAPNPANAWNVNFNSGPNANNTTNTNYVRLVRSGA